MEQQQELDLLAEELRKTQIEIGRLLSKQQLSEFDKKILEKLQEKNDVLLNKQYEAKLIQEENEKQPQIIDQYDVKKSLQQSIAITYDQQQNQQKQKQFENIQNTLKWETSLLEHNKEKLAIEAQNKQLHKQYLTQVQKEAQEQAIMRQQYKKQENFMDKNDYLETCKKNAEKEQIKEQNYKQFYTLASQNQRQHQNMHFEKVLKPLQTKQQELEAIQSKNVYEYQQQRAQYELNVQMNRKRELESNQIQNLQMVIGKQNQKEQNLDMKRQNLDERLNDYQQYQKYLQYKKQEKLKNQIEYNQFLNQQMKQKHDNGMIEQRNFSQPSQPSSDTTQVGAPTPSQLKSYANAAQKSLQQQQYTLPQQTYKQFQKIGESLERYSESSQITSKNITNQNNIQSKNIFSGHNPITNPMPFNIQNRYIATEIIRAQGKNENIFIK